MFILFSAMIVNQKWIFFTGKIWEYLQIFSACYNCQNNFPTTECFQTHNANSAEIEKPRHKSKTVWFQNIDWSCYLVHLSWVTVFRVKQLLSCGVQLCPHLEQNGLVDGLFCHTEKIRVLILSWICSCSIPSSNSSCLLGEELDYIEARQTRDQGREHKFHVYCCSEALIFAG